MTFDLDLRLVFGERVRAGVALAPYTTFRIGGPADWLVETHGAGELQHAVQLARRHGVPLTLLGGGSNVLVSDRGIRGLVVRPRGGDIAVEPPSGVRADAPVAINGLVRWTTGRGLAGLEAWAGTPGTVGGALHGNAHFRGANIGELVARVRVVTPAGELVDLPHDALGFGYDTSRFQTSGDVVVSAVFRVTRGDPAALREVARASLGLRKATQPLNMPSAGCIFQNPPPGGEAGPDGASAGALIDRAGLKGARVGGASVSPVHANFIVNEGDARAADVRALIERCREAVAARFSVVLREEIVYLGEW